MRPSPDESAAPRSPETKWCVKKEPRISRDSRASYAAAFFPLEARQIAAENVSYFNRSQPHQGIRQRIPDGPVNDNHHGRIVATPVLGGLHHDYRRVA